MYFDRDFVGKVDCNAYQIKNVQFGMYMKGNFGQKNVASTYQTSKRQNGMYFCGCSERKIA